jgi:SAM-dependent methyltransferase
MSSNWLDRLICPSTGEPLIAGSDEDGQPVLRSTPSGRRYRMVDGVFNMIPDPLPAELAPAAALWETLQHNGNVSYVVAPEINLQGDAAGFAEFLGLSGIVLDVGCGPQRDRPVYARDVGDADYVGIDPLPGVEERSFSFFQALGEALPFADRMFDQVVLAGSLDHMLNWQRGLREATRVAAADGAVHIKISSHPMEAKRGALARLLYIGVRGIGQIRDGIRAIGLRRTIGYVWRIARLKVPEGAIDYFHVYLPTEEELTAFMGSLGWTVRKRHETKVEVYLTFRAAA